MIHSFQMKQVFFLFPLNEIRALARSKKKDFFSFKVLLHITKAHGIGSITSDENKVSILPPLILPKLREYYLTY